MKKVKKFLENNLFILAFVSIIYSGFMFFMEKYDTVYFLIFGCIFLVSRLYLKLDKVKICKILFPYLIIGSSMLAFFSDIFYITKFELILNGVIILTTVALYSENIITFSKLIVMKLYMISLIVYILLVSFFCTNNYKAYKWIERFKKGFNIGTKYSVPVIKVNKLGRYRFNQLKAKYKGIDNFPSTKDYSRDDVYDLFNSVMECVVDDSLKQEYKTNINKYVDDYCNKNNINQ